MRGNVLCLDLGGTSLKCALVRNGKLGKRFRTPTDIAHGRDGIAETFARALDFYRDERFDGVAVSSAGTIDSAHGTVTYATDLLPDYTGFRLRDWFTARTGLPCVCINDGHAAALCESAGERGVVLVLALGTGVGGAYVENGVIDEAASREIGHRTLVENGLPCTCGKRGCIEQYISGTALTRTHVGDSNAFWRAVETGEADISDWLTRLRAACDLLYAEKPFDTVVFGGGVADDGKRWLPLARFDGAPYRVRLAVYGNDAALLGAYRSYCQDLKNRVMRGKEDNYEEKK